MKRVKLWVAVALPLIIFTQCKPEDITDVVDNDDPTDQPATPSPDDEPDNTDSDVPISDPAFMLTADDLELRPMQDIAKPGYLQTIEDPSFGTTIRRITDGGDGYGSPNRCTVQFRPGMLTSRI